MFICRRSRSALKLVSHWVQETYCAVGQQIGEQLEALSDGLAAQRYRCEIRSQRSRSAAISPLPEIQLSDYRLINGHKNTR
ncbi:MAG: hypothetical protein ACLP7Q_02585 [Isosphaeraceae bacterium]